MSWLGRQFSAWIPGNSAGGAAQPLVPIPRTPHQWDTALTGLFGPPQRRVDMSRNRAVSQIYGGPYQGPLDLDRYGGETPRSRREYRDEYSRSPILRAAIRGKANDIASLPPTIHVFDKTDAEANDAAEFLDRTIQMSPGGWPGVIDSVYLGGSLDGYSACEWRVEEQRWRGRTVWGLAQVRPLDTNHVRYQLDRYFNVLGVVNLVAGLDDYDPAGYLLYSHHGLFNSPFGQSDCRAAIEAVREIAEVYKLWYIALKIYGLPYMKGKTTAQNRGLMEQALINLREGGWIVTTNDKDDVQVIDMALGATLTGFESYVNIRRQDIFYGTRLAALPFLEGNGGQDAHGSSQIEQGTSDAGEMLDAHKVADVINRQLFPRLLGFNYSLDRWRMPQLKLGGTNLDRTKKALEIIKAAQEAGMDPSADWARNLADVQAARDPDDRLVTPEEKQQQQQAQQQQQQAAQQAALQPQQAPQQPGQPQPPKQLPPKAEPAEKPVPPAQMAATFSAGHAPAVGAEQLSRVVGLLLEEMAA